MKALTDVDQTSFRHRQDASGDDRLWKLLISGVDPGPRM